jgi:hypothetical protein
MIGNARVDTGGARCGSDPMRRMTTDTSLFLHLGLPVSFGRQAMPIAGYRRGRRRAQHAAQRDHAAHRPGHVPGQVRHRDAPLAKALHRASQLSPGAAVAPVFDLHDQMHQTGKRCAGRWQGGLAKHGARRVLFIEQAGL